MSLFNPEDIMKMAVGLIPSDLQYDMNNDGRITSADAVAYVKQNPRQASEPVKEEEEEQEESLAPRDLTSIIEESNTVFEDTWSSEMDKLLKELTPSQQEAVKDGRDPLEGLSGRMKSSYVSKNPKVVEYLNYRLNKEGNYLNDDGQTDKKETSSGLDDPLNTYLFDSRSMGRRQDGSSYFSTDNPMRLAQQAKAAFVTEQAEEQGIPLYKEVDGQKLYLNTGTIAHQGNEEGGTGTFFTAGDVGTYSTFWQAKERGSILDRFTANPVFRTALAVATGFTSEAVNFCG